GRLWVKPCPVALSIIPLKKKQLPNKHHPSPQKKSTKTNNNNKFKPIFSYIKKRETIMLGLLFEPKTSHAAHARYFKHSPNIKTFVSQIYTIIYI
ncbi:hypothetical protein ACVGXN_02090, partial [Enterobacter hormaechei]